MCRCTGYVIALMFEREFVCLDHLMMRSESSDDGAYDPAETSHRDAVGQYSYDVWGH